MTALQHFALIPDTSERELALKACDMPNVPCKSLVEAYLNGISESSERQHEPYRGYFLNKMNEAGIKQLRQGKNLQ